MLEKALEMEIITYYKTNPYKVFFMCQTLF